MLFFSVYFAVPDIQPPSSDSDFLTQLSPQSYSLRMQEETNRSNLRYNHQMFQFFLSETAITKEMLQMKRQVFILIATFIY